MSSSLITSSSSTGKLSAPDPSNLDIELLKVPSLLRFVILLPLCALLDWSKFSTSSWIMLSISSSVDWKTPLSAFFEYDGKDEYEEYDGNVGLCVKDVGWSIPENKSGKDCLRVFDNFLLIPFKDVDISDSLLCFWNLFCSSI